MPNGRALVLVVDDHELLRQLTARLLDGCGLEVVALGDTAAAIEVARTRCDELALLLSDVSMPSMSGPELGVRVREVCPDVPLLFVTGFAPEGLAGQLPPGATVLEKPFTRDDLLARVRAAREGDPRP
jgi:CheY-like chemotaxis protein